MKPKTTLILLVVLVVLAAVATLFETNKRKSRRPEQLDLFPAFAVEKADRITIQGKEKTVVLAKAGEEWVVETEEDQVADPKLPQQILDAVTQFERATMISTSPERRATFQVDSAGVSVLIEGSGETLASFVVGKAGPDFMSNYVLPSGRDEVYQVPVYMLTMVDRGDQSWRKTVLFETEKDRITGYTTHNQTEEVTVEKQADGRWKITAPVEAMARDDIVRVVLNSLTPIRSTAFADSGVTRESAGLEADTTWVEIRTDDGKSHKVTIGAATERNQSYTAIEGDPVIYLVPRGRWNTVIRPLGTLRVAEPEQEDQVPPGVVLPGEP